MNRRFFTKAAGASMVGVLAGCTEFNSDEDAGSTEPDTENETENDSPETDDNGSEADGDNETETENDSELDRDNETEADNDSESDPDTETETNDTENETSEEEVTADEEDGETDDEETPPADSNDSSEAENNSTDSDDSAPADPGTLEGEAVLDSELDGRLEVDHEFVWESGDGSHLCTITVEMENTTSSAELFYGGFGMIVDGDGNSLSSDYARFSLGSGTTSEHTFSLDQCADAAAYRVEFEADQVVEE
ncbi:hypothetical protein GWG54_17000 [Natronococcus sp. JC468]|uniref:hypothetical protein n=1 Tax=Natronococcus sp. JC468 TaxID=1961921 RepID=UPI001439600E|nr:hypothetical protein [Natronococcus sp. JC468]NKE37474.1 hypothetical protein [Natronococcus sp. JC468]